MKEYFVVGALKQSMEVRIGLGTIDLHFKDAGFFGMLPVFDSMEDAKEYADGRFDISIYKTRESEALNKRREEAGNDR